MQFIFLTFLLISSFWSVESNSAGLSLLNALFNPQPTADCVPSTNDYCPIINVIHEIFPGGTASMDSMLNMLPDEITLNEIIIVALQQAALYILDNPEIQPDDFDALIQELVRLVTVLDEQGSSHITWKDLHPLVRRLLSALFSPQRR